jgi:O-methyltransferase
MLKNVIGKVKDFLLFTRVFLLFRPFAGLFQNMVNFSTLTKWANDVNKNDLLINDFYTTVRPLEKRFKLYEKVGTELKLENAKINYLEFGVASGTSFKFWADFNKNPESVFAGFDTFEGLPEDWGTFKKGEMSFSIPQINDSRAEFMKGLFQDTLLPYLDKKGSSLVRGTNIIHLDADLFSSTIFVLTQLYKYLKKGDILFFDEFSVPNHEYLAYKIFVSSFNIKLKPIGAINNFFRIAFIVE